MSIKKLTIILAATLVLTGCNEDPEEQNAKAENVIACAFNKNADAKAKACDALNASEKRILKCAVGSNQGPRKMRCKDLSESEQKLVPRIDAARPRGTTFNFTTRKMGE